MYRLRSLLLMMMKVIHFELEELVTCNNCVCIKILLQDIQRCLPSNRINRDIGFDSFYSTYSSVISSFILCVYVCR